MQLLTTLPDFILHFDKYLPLIVAAYGIWTYIMLFFIIFLEAGLFIFPYLPGDSLLFITGALAEKGVLNLGLVLLLLTLAAIIGGIINYWIGRLFGHAIMNRKSPVIRKEYIEHTHEYFEKYGAFTIFIARFIPIVRSFAPFFAGIGEMNFIHFMVYNVAGGIAWVCVFVIGGYLFGNIPAVQDNFGLVIIAIIGVSLLGLVPLLIKWFRLSED